MVWDHRFGLGGRALLMVFCCFSFAACGPSSGERQLQQKAKRDAAQQRGEQTKAELLRKIKAKFDYVQFPGEGLPDTPFTYDLQRFVAQNADKLFLFGGYLEDVEDKGDDFTVEFVCPVGAGVLHDQPVVTFHLRTNAEQALLLLQGPRPPAFLRSFRFFTEPDFFVIARITKVNRARRYEIRASGREEQDEIELNVETPPRFVAAGELIGAYGLPRGPDKSDAKR